MPDQHHEVLPTIDVKTHLNTYLKRVREQGVESEPVYFGAHRKREAVIISAARYQHMLDTIQDLGYQLLTKDAEYQADLAARKHRHDQEMLGLDPVHQFGSTALHATDTAVITAGIDKLLNVLEDIEIAGIVRKRLADPTPPTSLDDVIVQVGFDPKDFI